MQQYTIICNNIQQYAVYNNVAITYFLTISNMQPYATMCNKRQLDMKQYATICPNMQQYAQICNNM